MPSITEQVGRVIGGRYRLLAPIGAGASAQVFAAVDTRLGRRVAVKVLHPALETDETFLQLFRAEARFAASLDHPNVMRVFDWGEEDAGPYLVLEMLTGGSLRGLLDKGVLLDHAQATSLGKQAAAGLSYAHRRGIIHRDIKPGNLLFDDEGHLRIGDFGVARAIAEAAMTEPLGSMFGTARYASPEQATGATLDDRTDVYSLALVLYEALTGRVPFSSDNIATTLAARVGASLPPAREIGPLTGVLAAAAIPEPLARLDATSLASELEQLARELPPPEPLPLARLDLGPHVAVWAQRDPTDLDPGHPSVAMTEVPGPPATTATTPLVASGVTGSPVAGGPVARSPAGEAPRRKRRVLALVLSGLVLLALLVAAVVAAFVHYDVYGHVVPKLVGEQVSTARAVVGNDDLRLVVSSSRYSKLERGELISQSIPPKRREKAHTVIYAVESKGPAPVPVPDVIGESEKAAKGAISSHKLVAKIDLVYSETVPAGTVSDQSPRTGKATPRSNVVLYVSKGPHPRIVPDVRGEDLAAAEQALKAVQLAYAVGPGQYSTTVPEGDVISEDPAPKTSRPRGSTVTLVVSLGEPYVTIPPVSGTPLSQATSELHSLGLKVAVYGPSYGSVVVDSAPPPGSSVREGSTVDLYVV